MPSWNSSSLLNRGMPFCFVLGPTNYAVDPGGYIDKPVQLATFLSEAPLKGPSLQFNPCVDSSILVGPWGNSPFSISIMHQEKTSQKEAGVA